MSWSSSRAADPCRVVQAVVLAFGAAISTFGRSQEPELAADLPAEEQKSLLTEYRRNYDHSTGATLMCLTWRVSPNSACSSFTVQMEGMHLRCPVSLAS